MLWHLLCHLCIYFFLTDKYSSQFGGGSQYAYFHEEDEASFQLVDTAKTQKSAYQRNRMRFAQVHTLAWNVSWRDLYSAKYSKTWSLISVVLCLQRNLRRDKDRRNLTQFNLQTLPKSAKQKERDRMRLQKKFQKQFGVRQKWDQKSQVHSPLRSIAMSLSHGALALE